MQELKMWLAVRTDLAMSPQKMAVQSGHAFQLLLMHVLNDDAALAAAYLTDAMPKIVVRADNEEHLLKIDALAKEAGIHSVTIRDAGRTEFSEPTLTVCAFGPKFRDDLPSGLKRLRLFGD